MVSLVKTIASPYSKSQRLTSAYLLSSIVHWLRVHPD